MKCTNCGTDFDEGVFCPECGTKCSLDIANETEGDKNEDKEAVELIKEICEEEKQINKVNIESKKEGENDTYKGIIYVNEETINIAQEEADQIELLKKKLLTTKKQSERRKIIKEFGKEPVTLESKRRYHELKFKSELPKPKSILANWIYGLTIIISIIITVIMGRSGNVENGLFYFVVFWYGVGIPVWIVWKIILLIKSMGKNYYLNIKKI